MSCTAYALQRVMVQEMRVAKMQKKSDLPSKTCIVCTRPFVWRKKWEKVWDEVKYCSDKCRAARKA